MVNNEIIRLPGVIQTLRKFAFRRQTVFYRKNHAGAQIVGPGSCVTLVAPRGLSHEAPAVQVDYNCVHNWLNHRFFWDAAASIFLFLLLFCLEFDAWEDPNFYFICPISFASDIVGLFWLIKERLLNFVIFDVNVNYVICDLILLCD